MSKRLLAILLLLGFSTSILAQRVNYRQLVMQSQSPTIFIDDIILPGEDGKTTLAFVFRFNNDFIPFKKIPLNHNLKAPENAEFYSTIRLSTEIFEGKLNRREDPSANSASRDVWKDTLFTSNFEQTQSSKMYASGSVSTNLNPGHYNFILQLAMMQEVNERNTRRREIYVPDLSTKETGEVILVKKRNGNRLELMNMEQNVLFGEDFFALIRIPGYDGSAKYSIKVDKAKTSRRDTSSIENIYSAELKYDDVFQNSTIKLVKSQNPALNLVQGNQPYTYALVSIPGSTFENAPYLLKLTKEGQEEPVARSFFRSYWPNMPASLYNLDVAINNLNYIISEKELKQINSGNNRERERKFREFWESKDPTPNTVYNELMAEYYRRIDFAFKEFGSQENPMGHESDQGEVYIKYGPPSEKERRFPESGKTIELWKYPSRTFVFEATSGFGDFMLVGTR
ncbi:GWxTD domain-containing protein [Gracilimonas sp.]|uniref:GWxTD domain-containing protein n=1 Tax=Gracilimonas sp. TaxID=1974203 RepID=UPI003D0FB9A0